MYLNIVLKLIKNQDIVKQYSLDAIAIKNLNEQPLTIV
jgi:hypothetical protein